MARLTIGRILALSALLMCIATAAHADSSTNPRSLGPERGWVVALAVSPDFAQDGNMWAAPYGGRVFASRDGGASWSPSRVGISDPVVTGLAVSPDFQSDRTVFAAADDGVFRSTNGGVTWGNYSSGLDGHACRAFAFAANFATSATMFVATDGGVYRSVDRGSTWSRTPLTTPVISLATGSSEVVLAGSSSVGMERSTNDGLTWTSIQDFPAGDTALSLAVGPDGTALAGTDSGILRSSDAGQSWQTTNVLSDRIDAVSFSPMYASDGNAYAGSSAGNGVLETSDGGAQWSKVAGPPLPFVSSLAAAAASGGAVTLFAGTAGSGVYRSRDGGSTWRTANVGFTAAAVRQLSVRSDSLLASTLGGASVWNPSTASWLDLPVKSPFVTSGTSWGRHMFVGTSDQGLQVSYDAGTTWHDSGLTASNVAAVEVSPSYGSDRTVLEASDFVYRSTDSGISWTRATGIGGDDVRRFVYSPQFASDRTIFAATINHGVYRSVDGGLTWHVESSGLPNSQVSDILPSPSFSVDQTVYAATGGQGIYMSSDGGVNWAPLTMQPPHLLTSSLAWSANGSLLVGTEKGIFMRTPGAWRSLAVGWDSYVTDIAEDSSAGADTLYVGTLGDGVWTFALSTPSATSTSTKVAVPTSTPRPGRCCSTPVPSPTPGVKTVHKVVRAWVMPKPLHPGGVALLRIQGPAGARATVAMSSPGWRKNASLTLDRHGIGAVGLVAPARDFSVLVTARTSKVTGSTRFIMHLTH